jgi:hypothetical protein
MLVLDRHDGAGIGAGKAGPLFPAEKNAETIAG